MGHRILGKLKCSKSWMSLISSLVLAFVSIAHANSGHISSSSMINLQNVIPIDYITVNHMFCDRYSASNTDSAASNFVTCSIPNVCPGVQLEISDCSSTCIGDQFIRLFDAEYNELAVGDDGACESPLNLCAFTTFAYSGPSCTTLTLQQGCYDNLSCSGTIKVAYNYAQVLTQPPVVTPTTLPTNFPIAPTSIPTQSTILSVNDIACAPFSASNTDFARRNVAICQFELCPGTIVTVGNCEGTCHGDQIIRLYDNAGNIVASDDDGCSSNPYEFCSRLSYGFSSGSCQVLSLHQGCYGDDECSGVMSITRQITSAPTSHPTSIRTELPTSSPTYNHLGPSDTSCAAYTASDTNNAKQNYVICQFELCGGMTVTANNCDGSCIGDQRVILYDSHNAVVTHDDDGCSSSPYEFCVRLVYTYPSGQCQTFSLHQGCYDDDDCGGTIKIAREVTTTSPTFSPSGHPTFPPSALPTIKPTSNPTLFPSSLPSQFPSSLPTEFPSVLPTTKPTSKPSLQPSAMPTENPTIKPSSLPTIAPSAARTEVPTVSPTLYPGTGFADTNIVDSTPVVETVYYRSKYVGVVYNLIDCAYGDFDDSDCQAMYPDSQIVTVYVENLPVKLAVTYSRRYPSSSPTVIPTAKPTTPPSPMPTRSPTPYPIANPTNAPLASFGYVGSFSVNQGVSWTTNPPSYSCIEACAYLYGGSSGSYQCSTTTSYINRLAYLDGWADTRYCSSPTSDTYKLSSYYNCGSYSCSFSALVMDHGCGNVNYCYRTN